MAFLMKLTYMYILRFWTYIKKGKDCTQQEYSFIICRLACLICIPNALRAGVFPSATIEEFECREKSGEKGKDKI